MNSNFDFINDERLNDIKGACIEAEKGLLINPSNCVILVRKALEISVKWVYSIDSELEIPYSQTLATLIYDQDFQNIFDYKIIEGLKYIQKLGNLAVHSTSKISKANAVVALNNLHTFIQCITYMYCDDFVEDKFNIDKLPNPEKFESVNILKIKELEEKLNKKQSKIEELKLKFSEFSESATKNRITHEATMPFDVKDISEYETRKNYIDIDLQIAGWNNWTEEEEVEGMPNQAGKGYVDYVLKGRNGKPVALVEAKRTTKEPIVGKQQAKIYADLLEKKYNQRPIIYYSNGFETYMWDDLNYPPRRVSGFYTQDELELLIDRRTLRKNLKNININENIAGRFYQEEAVKSFCSTLNNGSRKGLLVMATGTGKTRTAVSLVEVLSKNNWVKNVLFLADRTELVKQAKKSFVNLLPNFSVVNLTEHSNHDTPPENARLVFSTYQTMMNAIDNVKKNNGNKLFTIGHFDLIIVDEAHRSIYKKYQAIFDYFDGYLLGLTATPRSDIDKNTYSIFDLPDNNPTYYYEYETAVKEGYLVDYHTIKCPTSIVEHGIHYSELSEEDQEQYEETFSDDISIEEDITPSAINSWLFNEDTIKKVLQTLMEKGLKVESNDKLGKTIIFAKNHKHAVRIQEIFDQLYPHYHGQFAAIIDNHINYASDLIDKFEQFDKMPQIAISVDMLDTGIDVPEILNLVFFKDVKSKVKFNQMIGRGTRKCKDLFGYMKDKKEFYIFDVCKNFEFFEQNPKGKETAIGMSLSQYLFEIKIDIVKELESSKYLGIDEYVNYKNFLLEGLVDLIDSLNVERFDVKQKLQYVEEYKELANWNNLTDITVKEIKDNLTNLIDSNDTNESAKQFDKLILSIEYSIMLNIKYDAELKKLYNIGTSLLGVINIPQVKVKEDIIKLMRNTDSIKQMNIIELDKIREEIRELLIYLPVTTKRYYYTNFADDINIIEDDTHLISDETLNDYKEKVNFYLRNHMDNPVIKKIRNNEKISPEEVKELENILFNDLNSSKEEYNSNYNNESLILLIRKTVGLSEEAIDREFAKFSNDCELSAEQTRFINLIKNYVMKNGVIDKRILNDDPFANYGNIVDLFRDNRNILEIIIAFINLLNLNGEYFQENN